MDNLDEFKAFLKQYQVLKRMYLIIVTGQIYEIYTMYGENDHFF